MIHITERKVTHEDYEDDDFERAIKNERYDYENIRYCSCGKRMEKVIEHQEIYGHWIPIEKWECPDCD